MRRSPGASTPSATPTTSSCVDTPLLTVTSEHEFDAVIVVDVPVETAVERLVRFRGMDEADARARIGKQISREERVAWPTV